MRVLVIDDEKFIADTLTMILEGAGMTARAAYDGRKALKEAESFHPTLVISDVIMPGMNGIEVCMAIQAKYPECHFILSSGQAATTDLIRDAQEKGVKWELLAKPIDPEDLLKRVASISEEKSTEPT